MAKNRRILASRGSVKQHGETTAAQSGGGVSSSGGEINVKSAKI